MEAVVEATDVEKAYGETVALAGASLSVERGDVFALIGPNGAGKTTLVRALTGTIEPDGGTARILGASPTAVDRDRIGVLPQEFSPPGRLSGRELIAYYAGLYDDAREPDDVLAAVGLVDAGETRFEALSGGQKRRVCVGSALVNDPELLFLDEPTTGIDPAGRRTVWRLIEGLADAGTTVVMTTHDMAEAERLADRVGLLADGRLVEQGTPEELVERHAGSSRLTIETGADLAAFDDLEYPAERPERGRNRSPEGAVVVRGVEPAEIGAVVEYLETRDLAYTELSWTEPDIEDVYLALADATERERTDRTRGRDGGDGDADFARTGETA